MPWQKTPTTAEMARLVEQWSRRCGEEMVLPDPLPEGGPAHDRLGALYQGWAAVQWVEEHGERVTAEDLAALLGSTRVRASISADKRL